MEWTDELIAKLRDLWSQGLSTAEIGRQLSITKNAVVGKAHRLELPPRPSPIRNKPSEEGGETPARPRKAAPRKKKAAAEELPLEGGRSSAQAETKAAQHETPEKPRVKNTGKAATSSAAAKVLSENKAPAKEKKTAAPKAASSEKPSAEVASRQAAAVRKMAPPRRVREAMDRSSRQGPSCQWPIGDPGTPGFHFCGATPLPGKPYCAEHAAVAYVKIRDRRH